MNKTLLKTTALALCLSAFSFQAKAENLRLNEGFFFQPYVGVGYTRANVDFGTSDGVDWSNHVPKDYNAFNIFAGSRIHKHLGFELGYTHSDEPSRTTTGAGGSVNIKTKVKAYTFDALGYLPLPVNEKVELIGSIGVGEYKMDTNLRVNLVGLGLGTASDRTNETALRLGLGAQYFITDNINVRGMYRYVNLDKGMLDGANTFSLDISYSF